MAVLKFPPVESADENGLLALGGDLDVETLMLAYQQGIFPWPISEEFPLAWFSPDPRGVIEIRDLKINKRLRRYLFNNNLKFTCNTAFESVIRQCSKVPRKQQSGTWITEEVVQSYLRLFEREYAYSIEAWEGNQLVGGIYGISINGIITGESMFHLRPNTSKICLCALLLILKNQGFDWLDTQMVTPVIKSLGGKEISRKDFLANLKQVPLRTRKEIFPQSFDNSLFISEFSS